MADDRLSGARVSRRAVLGGALAAGAALGVGVGSAAGAPLSKFAFPTSSKLTVLVTGDAGTGGEAQYAVAAAARKVFASEPLSLTIGLGDNIYEDGAETASDDEFRTKFEEPNAGLDVPWLMALGNHDNTLLIPGDGSWLSKGDREVAYHSLSRRWWMPSRYYSVALPADEPVVEFFVIDTNPLCSYVPALLGRWSAEGPYMTEQKAWLRRALAASTARWKIVCSHHPYLNNGPHGDAGAYDGVPLLPHVNGTFVKQWFEADICGRAYVLLAGHDHSQQILAPTAASKGSWQVISGAAGKSVDGRSHATNEAHYQDFTNSGFMVLDVTGDSAGLRVYTVDVATAEPTLAYRHDLSRDLPSQQ